MKKLMMMLFAATLAVTAVQAQDGRKEMKHKNPEEKAQMMTSKMQKNLNLSDDQVARVNEIHLQQATKMAEIREKHGDNREAARAEMKGMRAETNKRYAAVLTPEQLAKKDQLKKERKEKMKAKHGDRKGKGHKKGHDNKN